MSNALARFAIADDPTPAFIDEMRRRFPTEPEIDALFVRKLQRRSGPAYSRQSMQELQQCIERMLAALSITRYELTNLRWFTGGVSKIQLGFDLEWDDFAGGKRFERMVVRMDPNEGSNTTSRLREFELLSAFHGTVPVPRPFWLDRNGDWFPEPALIYEFAEGVTKPTSTATGQVSGMGTNFGPQLREKLADQFMRQLASIHTFDFAAHQFESLVAPAVGTTQSAAWQLNRALRIWEEDRCEDFPLMDVASAWLRENLPPLDTVSVVHGDYRSGNFLFDEKTGQINAWLDWERGHLGDRHRDLAWTTHPSFGHYSEDGKTYYICGLIPRDEFYDRYSQASGLSVDHGRLEYYRILNCFQIIASVSATATRVARLGKSHQDVLLTRVKGMESVTGAELVRLLKEKL
jgi:aminoglycoside phosphotransferase (APT) family kinase protein